jgi:hypothetical protein
VSLITSRDPDGNPSAIWLHPHWESVMMTPEELDALCERLKWSDRPQAWIGDALAAIKALREENAAHLTTIRLRLGDTEHARALANKYADERTKLEAERDEAVKALEEATATLERCRYSEQPMAQKCRAVLSRLKEPT